MEELLSTEVLDREILEDARKKAYKILKTADENLSAHVRDWEEKTLQAVTSIKKNYTERINKTEEEILARLPLDKRRLRSETAENFIKKAIYDFLLSLGREKLLAILEEHLSQRLTVFDGDEKREVIYSGLSLDEVRGVLERAYRRKQGGAWDFIENTHAGSSGPLGHEFPSVVINTPALKINVSVEDAANTMLKEKRAELASALLGAGVLDD